MNIIGLIVVLVIVGVILYIANALIPMDARVKMVVNALVGLFLFLYVLEALGIWHSGLRFSGR